MPKTLQVVMGLLTVALSSTVACGPGTGGLEWLRLRDARQSSEVEWRQVPVSQVEPVPASRLAMAIDLLGDAEYRALKQTDLSDLDVEREIGVPGMVPFLVRAVSNEGTRRSFTVLMSGTAIVVRHGSLAKHTALQKDAVIVALEAAPSAVYVEASVSQ